MATITPAFKTQGTVGSTGNYMTCLRYGNSGASSTCDIGGSGSGSDYRNVIAARFDSLPSGAASIQSATVTITFQKSGSDYWSAAQTLSVQGCANITNSTTGTNRPTLYGSAKSGNLAGSTASVTIDCLAQIRSAMQNGSKCLFISANAGNNRKRVASVTLTYTASSASGHITFNGSAVNTVVFNGTTVSHVTFNGTTLY